MPGTGVAALLVMAVIASATAHAAPSQAELLMAECGNPFDNGAIGPWDYNDGEDRTNPQKIPIIEKFHFNRDVEGLDRGESSAYALDDLDYVLRAVPNHPRALNAVARYDVEKGGIPPKWRSAECWFDRAMRFKPDDGTVYLLFANYKSRKGQVDEALEAYQTAKKLLPESIEVDYNLGLLYVKMGDYPKALERARVAYAGNYPLQGLKKKLAEKGYSVGP
jgi:tetratricopeptide (TPR) repeat protein